MLEYVLTLGLTVVLLCGFVYVLLQRIGDHIGGPLSPGADRPDGVVNARPSCSEPLPQRSLDQAIGDIPVLPPALFDESSQPLDAYLVTGMALTFVGEDTEPQSSKRLFTVEDVREDVRQTVLSHIASLKHIDAFHRFQKMFSDAQASVADISRLIMSDPVLSAIILRMANSPYYGMQQKLNSISHAIMVIGMVNLKAVIYQEIVMKALNERKFQDDDFMRTLWHHANLTAIYASYLDYLYGGLNKGTLFTLGLLHDIGKYIMMRLTPLPSNPAEAIRPYSPLWTMEEEERTYGINHALVGRLACEHWGLSKLMVEVVTLHHALVQLRPAEHNLTRETLQYLLVLFLSDQAARLYVGKWTENVRIDRLLKPYHRLVDQKKLLHLIVDKSLLAQIRESEIMAGARL